MTRNIRDSKMLGLLILAPILCVSCDPLYRSTIHVHQTEALAKADATSNDVGDALAIVRDVAELSGFRPQRDGNSSWFKPHNTNENVYVAKQKSPESQGAIVEAWIAAVVVWQNSATEVDVILAQFGVSAETPMTLQARKELLRRLSNRFGSKSISISSPLLAKLRMHP